MKTINVIFLFVILIFSYLSDSYEYQEGNNRLEYTGYVAPSLDVFLKEYNAFDRAVDEFELDQKLFTLLENPNCWYNQRGKKVILLFNETNFPEEYAILRKSNRLFGPNNRLESDFLVLEEEEEREQYMDFYEQIKDIHDSDISKRRSIYKDIIIDEKGRYDYLDSYSENKTPSIKDLVSEDLEKEKYKSRIKKLIKMKENTLKRIFQTSSEIGNLESSFIMHCDFPDCSLCNDFQSHLNSKYIELNKHKHRYRMIISLFKEFVDHSNKFSFDYYDENNNTEWNLKGGVDHTKKMQDFIKKRNKIIKRPNFNITKEDDHIVDGESNYRELKRMLKEAEREIDILTQKKEEATGDNQQSELTMIECTRQRLEELISGNEKLSLLIRSVKFFIESLFERTCPKCDTKSFNGFTKFGDMIDTQIRILKYYQSEKNRLKEDIQSCIYFLENKAIELDDDSQYRKSSYSYLPINEYNRKLNKIYEKYKEYGKNNVDFEKLIYGSSRNWKVGNKDFICDINSSVLMNELSKEIMSRIISSEIQKRVYLKRKECGLCSYNDCQKCYENSIKLKNLENNIKAQNKLYKAISAHLELCGFEQVLVSSRFKDLSKKSKIESEYFGKDGRLWSAEKYLSEPFINRVLKLDVQLSPFLRAKILERIKLTLQAFIKVFKLSSFNINRSECTSCEYGLCNDCYNRFTEISDGNRQITKYSHLLRLVNLELEKYFVQIRKTNTNSSIKSDAKEWILIRDGSLRKWLPNKPELILKCDKESYSEALTYYNEILLKRKHLQNMSEHIYNSIMNNTLKFSEHYFSKQAIEWESIWREKAYYDEIFSYINRYLSSCVNKNEELNNSFHDYLFRKSEIRSLYKSFQEQSEVINCLMEKIKEIDSRGYIECSKLSTINCCNVLVSPDDIYKRLNSEFNAFKLIRKRLNSHIYNEHLNYFDHNQDIFGNYYRDKLNNHFSRYLNMSHDKLSNKKRIRKEKLDKIKVEYQDIIRSPIPGMSKYLHKSEPITNSKNPGIIQLSPKAEFQCSKTEIFVLQRITSLLSQNQGRLSLLKSLNSVRCEVQDCYNCKVRSKFHDKLGKELKILSKVLNTAAEQLNQCMLDSEDNFINKEDIIEFKNTLIKLSKKESSFNTDLKKYIDKIKDFQCEKKEIESILTIKEEKGMKIYLWIEETLVQIQTLNDEDENMKNEYTIWTQQVTQLLDFSKALEERLQECINTIDICTDHSKENNINKGNKRQN
ncbi:signal peptide containing protein [Cryptosporidium sp. chipmunk genotype I]|uniref:signal peptide containing protein n=1 Tax=Cryptosporidium sp. chipmunk genotype I TaxID=1280935 RepID=UPI00351A3366|nr:signal peptide containing protein [Cryptosporidium sp. chipmunk genotype I]